MSQLSNIRIGRITSSDISALVSKGVSKDSVGVPFFTYVQECIMERFFKQRLDSDVDVLAMAWGRISEKVVHNNLPLHYIFHSDNTLEHPEIPEWVGTPDGSKNRGNKIQTVTDIKCPLTRKSFFHLIAPLYVFDGIKAKRRKKKMNGNEAMRYIRDNHKDGDKYYWQLVSNACITGAKWAELIVFMPYYEELEAIRAYNANLDEPNYLVFGAKDEKLPFIYRQSGVKNLNIIRFEVPEEDKQILKERVKLAVELIYEGNTDKKFMQEKVKELMAKK